MSIACALRTRPSDSKFARSPLAPVSYIQILISILKPVSSGASTYLVRGGLEKEDRGYPLPTPHIPHGGEEVAGMELCDCRQDK